MILITQSLQKLSGIIISLWLAVVFKITPLTLEICSSANLYTTLLPRALCSKQVKLRKEVEVGESWSTTDGQDSPLRGQHGDHLYVSLHTELLYID